MLDTKLSDKTQFLYIASSFPHFSVANINKVPFYYTPYKSGYIPVFPWTKYHSRPKNEKPPSRFRSLPSKVNSFRHKLRAAIGSFRYRKGRLVFELLGRAIRRNATCKYHP